MADEFQSKVNPEHLRATLASMYGHRGAKLEQKLLGAATAELTFRYHDNWDGGTDYYSFVLHVPVETFALLSGMQDEVEKRLLDEVRRVLRAHDTGIAYVQDVVIAPDVSLAASAPPVSLDSTVWPPDHFRLFLSHVSAIKTFAHSVKEALSQYGIAGFVAHDDIEPTRDWQNVIESALRSMDALAALLTPEFPASRWCDQEVGVAVGRTKLVIPVRLGIDPYGFMARYQALLAPKGATAAHLAGQMATVLMRHDQTALRFAEAALRQFATVNSFARSKQMMKLLEGFDHLPVDALRSVAPALETNIDLHDAFGVPDRFRKLLARHGAV